MTAADFDFREIAHNWHTALSKLGLTNGLVYSYDVEVHEYLSARKVPTFDGSANIAAWNRTRVGRHIQRAEAERHMAAAALAASGIDVLLTDASHVLLGDVAPDLHALAKEGNIDMAVPRAGCTGKPPAGGCGLWWNLVYLRGAGSAEQRERAVAFQVEGIKRGMIDFYLRWWNGAHCILSGYGKAYSSCARGTLDPGITPDATLNRSTPVVLSVGGCHGLPSGGSPLRIGLLAPSFYNFPAMYAKGGQLKRGDAPFGLVARSPKPEQRDRLNLDRYDQKDFEELVEAMRADGIWFL